MGVLEYYSMDDSALEVFADEVKTVVLRALVRDGLIEEEVADKWAEEHTLLRRKKPLFRTLSDLWKKTETSKDAKYLIVVKKV